MPRNNYFPSVENKYIERSTAVWQARNVSTAMRVFLRTRLQNQRLKNGLKVFAQKKRLSIRRPFFYHFGVAETSRPTSREELQMIVQCVTCKSRLRVADEQIPEDGLKLRCSKCKTVLRVRRPAAPAPATPSLPVPPVAVSSVPPQPMPGADDLRAAEAMRRVTAFEEQQAAASSLDSAMGAPVNAPVGVGGTALFGDPRTEEPHAAELHTPSPAANSTQLFGQGSQPEESATANDAMAASLFEAQMRANAVPPAPMPAPSIPPLPASSLPTVEAPAAPTAPESVSPVSSGPALSMSDSAPQTMPSSSEIEMAASESPTPPSLPVPESPASAEEAPDAMNGVEEMFEEVAVDSAAGDMAADAAKETPAPESDDATPERAQAANAAAGDNAQQGAMAQGDDSADVVETVESIDVEPVIATTIAPPAAAAEASDKPEGQPEAQAPATQDSAATETEAARDASRPAEWRGADAPVNAEPEPRRGNAAGTFFLVLGILIVLVTVALVALHEPVRAPVQRFFDRNLGHLINGGDKGAKLLIDSSNFQLAETRAGKKLLVITCQVRNRGTEAEKSRRVRVDLVGQAGAVVAQTSVILGASATPEELYEIADERALELLLQDQQKRGQDIAPGQTREVVAIFRDHPEKLDGLTLNFHWDDGKEAQR